MNRLESIYVSTCLGNRFYPAAPNIDDVAVEDIAQGLAYQCRFNGQTQAFYSVAQHSLIVASLVPVHLRLAALLHDAAEAYLGDMVKPLKHFFPTFSVIENKMMAIIGERFAVTTFDTPEIKRADLIALATEKRDLMPNSTEPWPSIKGLEPMTARIVPMEPQKAKAIFLETYFQLGAQRSTIAQLEPSRLQPQSLTV